MTVYTVKSTSQTVRSGFLVQSRLVRAAAFAVRRLLV